MTWLSKFKFRTKMARPGEAEIIFLSKGVNSFPKRKHSFFKVVSNKKKSSLPDKEQNQMMEKGGENMNYSNGEHSKLIPTQSSKYNMKWNSIKQYFKRKIGSKTSKKELCVEELKHLFTAANQEKQLINVEEMKNAKKGGDFVPLGEEDLTQLSPDERERKEIITVTDKSTQPLTPEGKAIEKIASEEANMSTSVTLGKDCLQTSNNDRTIHDESLTASQTPEGTFAKQLTTEMANEISTPTQNFEGKSNAGRFTNPSYRQATTHGASNLLEYDDKTSLVSNKSKFFDRGDADTKKEESAKGKSSMSRRRQSKFGSIIRKSFSSEDNKGEKKEERRSKSRSLKMLKIHLTNKWSISSKSKNSIFKENSNLPKCIPSCWLNLLSFKLKDDLYSGLCKLMTSTAYDWSQVPAMPNFVDTDSVEFVLGGDQCPIPIGVGNFGSVYLARRPEDNELVVLKYVRVTSFGLFELIKEAGFNKILSDAFGQPAPKFFGLINRPLDNDHWPLAIVSEFVGDPITHKVFNLCDVLRCCTEKSSRIDRTEKTWLSVCIEITEAIANIHNLSIYINDLKSDNIILRPVRGGKWRIYIIDYGNATRGHHRLQLSTGGMSEKEFLTTYGQVAPEVLRKGYCSPASDIYSLGNILSMIHSCSLVGKTVNELGTRCLLEDYQARPSTAHITKQLMTLYQASLGKQKSSGIDKTNYPFKYLNTNLIQSVV
ncbi:DgyrCDS7601 [Dimorphilus gyrociliatus]|uniref:DgyrCDS7601 n=1 Tax=Dimorphilus gyrociliatus TaxID=2664684 RepID=A0A7I8VSH1_9ANNE|nr:DgyrCDS7601 [Dimorphilus gyrociliatus]